MIKEDRDMKRKQITIMENGPYRVEGNVPLDEVIMVSQGGHREYRKARSFQTRGEYLLCRCGRTSTPPFCDGSHCKVGFDGTQTASKMPFEERARVLRGPTLDLHDDGRCAYARFCHREDGDVWSLSEKSADAHLRREAIKAACDCPTGRLVHYDKTADYAQIESVLEPSIWILEDPDLDVSGPIYVRGGIALVGSDSSQYEIRNRYALCRCGASCNKPFCDASHVDAGFRDGIDSK